MSAKLILVETKGRRHFRFRYDQAGRIYAVTTGFISDSHRKIGEADTLEDALQVIKADLDDDVRDIRVQSG